MNRDEAIDIIARWHAVMKVNTQGGQGVAARSEAPAAVKFPEHAKRYEEAINALGWKAINLPHRVARRAFNDIPASVWNDRRAKAGNPPLWSEVDAVSVFNLMRKKTARYAALPGKYGNAASAIILNARTA